MLLYFLAALCEDSCLPGSSECIDNVMRTCDLNHKWTYVDCPMQTECRIQNGSIACASKDNTADFDKDEEMNEPEFNKRDEESITKKGSKSARNAGKSVRKDENEEPDGSKSARNAGKSVRKDENEEPDGSKSARNAGKSVRKDENEEPDDQMDETYGDENSQDHEPEKSFKMPSSTVTVTKKLKEERKTRTVTVSRRNGEMERNKRGSKMRDQSKSNRKDQSTDPPIREKITVTVVSTVTQQTAPKRNKAGIYNSKLNESLNYNYG